MKENFYNCDKCNREVPAYYTLSYITKGLWIKCPHCGTHAAKYIANLPLEYKPSKSYLRTNKKINPTGGQIKGVGTQISL